MHEYMNMGAGTCKDLEAGDVIHLIVGEGD